MCARFRQCRYKIVTCLRELRKTGRAPSPTDPYHQKAPPSRAQGGADLSFRHKQRGGLSPQNGKELGVRLSVITNLEKWHTGTPRLFWPGRECTASPRAALLHDIDPLAAVPDVKVKFILYQSLNVRVGVMQRER
jgi:hypothetical protein